MARKKSKRKGYNTGGVAGFTAPQIPDGSQFGGYNQDEILEKIDALKKTYGYVEPGDRKAPETAQMAPEDPLQKLPESVGYQTPVAENQRRFGAVTVAGGSGSNMSLRKAQQMVEQGKLIRTQFGYFPNPSYTFPFPTPPYTPPYGDPNDDGDKEEEEEKLPVESIQDDLEDYASGDKTLSEATQITQESLIKDGKLPEGTITKKEDIQKIGELTAVTPGKVSEEITLDTKAGIVTKATGPEDVNASGYQAAQIEKLEVGKAAEGEVSRVAEAMLAGEEVDVQAAVIEDRDVVKSRANLVDDTLSQGAFAKAVQAGEVNIDRTGLPELKDIDIMDAEVQAQVADLPAEALVSKQMDMLLEGMENGETPSWALPAVSAVEQALAARGMSASTVGQTALFSAIVSAALPIAQGNANAVKERAAQNLANRQQAELTRAQLQGQTDVSEAQLNQQNAVVAFQTDEKLIALQAKISSELGVANLNAAQQTAIYNASTQAGMDMSKFSTAQQVELANSKWMQTAVLTNVTNEQQAALQEATLMAQKDLANADALTRVQIENARNFLQMDVSNLSNKQQMEMLNTQNSMQKLLSNQSAFNAARQFNAASQNQVNTFMANLSNQINLQNAAMTNQMEQFNAQQYNVAQLQEAGMEAEAERFNTQLDAQVQQFNSQIDFQRDQWNAANAQAVEQSNVNWRRQANTADTAAANAINQQNAMNSFNLESSALSMLWQQLRDEAAFDQQSYIAYQTNATNLYATALSHENPSSASFSKIDAIIRTLGNMMSGGT